MTIPHIVDLDGSTPGSRELLGGKAYSVNKMRSLGLPVPAAFALTTPVCAIYHDNGAQLPDNLWAAVLEHLAEVEKATGRRFGVGPFPLLVSVRSGAAQSMPGMMDTVLNLGLTEQLTEALAVETGNRRWATDTWERFCSSYADIVLGTPGAQPPADPYDQLRAAIGAVFDSWTNDRVAAYRKRHGLGAGTGTAVTVQAMVFGNRDDQSGTGVLFSRDPGTGENVLFGEWLACAQGEDVVSGERTPSLLSELAATMPDQYAALQQISTKLEIEHRDLVDIEFTVESGNLYVLQCRSGKRSARAAVRIAVDLVRDGLITKSEAIGRITIEHAARLSENSGIAPGAIGLSTGTGASPGSATGVAFTDLELAQDAAAAGTSVVLVRPSTAPDDVPAMFDSVAVVTEVGGTTSHAALVCREIGLPCVVGCGAGTVDALVGKTITVDGSAGVIYDGNVLESGSSVDDHLIELLTYLPDQIAADHPLAALATLRLEGGAIVTEDPQPTARPSGIDAVFSKAGLLVDSSPAPKRANRRGEQTREKLIAAATECFTEYGYTRTRISDITHRADTAQGNFYRHFTSLDDIFMAALRPALEELSQSRGRPDRAHGELESLNEVNVTYLQAYSRHRHMLRLLREAAAASANEGFQQLWLNLRGDFVQRTHRWLQRLADAEVIVAGDHELLAETLGCMTEQMAYVHVGLPANTPKRERIDELGRILGQVWYRSLPLRGESRSDGGS